MIGWKKLFMIPFHGRGSHQNFFIISIIYVVLELYSVITNYYKILKVYKEIFFGCVCVGGGGGGE